jgi:hypothetical protein
MINFWDKIMLDNIIIVRQTGQDLSQEEIEMVNYTYYRTLILGEQK